MPLAEPLRLAAIVLAAGTSSRMRTNKLLLAIEDEPLVVRAVRFAREAGLAPVVVVTGFEAERVQAALATSECEIVINGDYTGLMSTSMHHGLWALPGDADGVLMMLPDMVHVTGSMVGAIVERARASGAPVVVSRYGDVTAPPVLFRRDLFPELIAWNGEGCGKSVVRAHAHEAAYVDWPRSALADVDTPADWDSAQ